jgi:hypothetical protein
MKMTTKSKKHPITSPAIDARAIALYFKGIGDRVGVDESRMNITKTQTGPQSWRLKGKAWVQQMRNGFKKEVAIDITYLINGDNDIELVKVPE